MIEKAVVIIDYGAGNVRSVVNAVEFLGCKKVKIAKSADDILEAEKIIFPGVGHFESAVVSLKQLGFWDALKRYINDARPYFGICLGLQLLANKSEEAPNCEGLQLINCVGFNNESKRSQDVTKLKTTSSIPHVGWNRINYPARTEPTEWSLQCRDLGRFYFVHSFCIAASPLEGFEVMTTTHGEACFISAIKNDNLIATQFHPEKSGPAGLSLLATFLGLEFEVHVPRYMDCSPVGLSKRIIACLDIRRNDTGKLIVTKGHKYNVRDRDGNVKELGNPIHLMERYYKEGVDEIVILNIKSFESDNSQDVELLNLITMAARRIFVPICVGGGIRNDQSGVSALNVAAAYFAAGADKMAICTDAVHTAKRWLKNGETCSGDSSIELISRRFGKQAVVISIDAIKNSSPEQSPKYVAMTNGGRVKHDDLDVVQLVRACDAMGAGEILVNSVDTDGTMSGFQTELLNLIKCNTTLPVIASSGAGTAAHFEAVFKETDVEAALAAGIFHSGSVSIEMVKKRLQQVGIPVRLL